MKAHVGKVAQGHSLQMVITGFFMGGMILLLLLVSVSLVTRLNVLLENNAMQRTRQTVDQGNASLGVLSIAVLFVAGFAMMLRVPDSRTSTGEK